jgi:hypothetical protein
MQMAEWNIHPNETTRQQDTPKKTQNAEKHNTKQHQHKNSRQIFVRPIFNLHW